MNIVIAILLIALLGFGIYNHYELMRLEKEHQRLARRFMELLQKKNEDDDSSIEYKFSQKSADESPINITDLIGTQIVLEGQDYIVDKFSVNDGVFHLLVKSVDCVWDKTTFEPEYEIKDFYAAFFEIRDILEGKFVNVNINGKYTVILKKS